MIYIRVYEAISTHTTATVVGFFSFKIVDNGLCKNCCEIINIKQPLN